MEETDETEIASDTMSLFPGTKCHDTPLWPGVGGTSALPGMVPCQVT